MTVPFLILRRAQVNLLSTVCGAAGLLFGSLQATESLVTDFDDPLIRLDGWKVLTAEGVANDIGNPRWEPAGGNPDGYFAVEDLARGGVIYYSAPPKFLGDRSAAYGLELRYDVSSTTTNSSFDRDDLVLEGENLRLIYRHDPMPEPDGWVSFSLLLEEGSRWRVMDVSEEWEGHGWETEGDTPSESQFIEVLADLRGLYIRGEFWSGSSSLGLDNVEMEVLAGSIQAPMEVVEAYWLGGDGDWTDAANWSTDSYPRNDVPEQGYRYRAIIDAEGDYTVTLDEDLLIEELELDAGGATLEFNSSTLYAPEGIRLLDGRMELNGSLLYATEVTGNPQATLAVTGNSRLLDVTLQSVELFIASGNDVLVAGDLTLDDAVIRLDRTSNFVDTRLRFDDGALQTLAGVGEVIFDGSSSGNLHRQRVEAINEGGHLVVESGITVRTGQQGGQLGNTDNPITNYGTVRAQTDGRFINFYGSNAVNEGSLEAIEGGMLRIDGSFINNAQISGDDGAIELRGDWSNAGTLETVDTLVDFGSEFTLADVGTFSRDGGTVRITGTLHNTGATLMLDESFGTWDLHGGAIIGGTVASDADFRLRATASGRLEEVTLQSVELFLASGNDVLVAGDLTLDDAVIRFDRTSNFVDTRLRFDDGARQTLAGVGEVIFDGTSSGNLHRQRVEAINEGAHLVLAEGITVRTGTQAGQIGNANYPFTNYGRLVAETSDRSLLVAGNDFINEGIIEVRDGGRIQISGLAGDLNTLIMDPSGGRVDLDGDYTLNQDVTVPEGAHLTLSGNWTNTATIILDEGRLDLGDTYSAASLGTITRTRGELRLSGTLENDDTVFDLTAISGDSGEITLDAGTINGGTLTGNDDVLIRVISNSRLENVTLSSLELFIASGNDVLVAGDLTLDDAVIRFGRTSNFVDTRLRFDDGALQTLAGVGEVIFDGTSSGNLHRQRVEAINEGAHLILAEGITVRTGTQAGQIGNASYPFTNYGRLVAETANRTLIAVGSELVNEGSLEAFAGGHLDVRGLSGESNTLLLQDENSRITLAGDYVVSEDVIVYPGTTLSLTGQWHNQATLFLDEGLLNCEGDFNTADLGNVESTGGNVRLIGNLDNTDSLFDIAAYAGNEGTVNLHGGTISGGIISGNGSSVLRVTNNGRLDDGIVLSSLELFIASGNDALVAGDLTLDDAVIRFDRTSNFVDTRLRFDDGALQTLAGVGEVIFDGTSSGNLHRQRVEAINEGAHLVLAEGITVRTGTQAGQVGNTSSPFTNYGRLVAETANRTLIVAGNDFVNEGILEARNGGTIDVRGLTGDSNDILFSGNGGRVILDGDYVINQDVLVPAEARLTLRGDWINQATITAQEGTIDLEGDWSNEGVLAVNDTLIDLDGDITLDALGTLQRDGGTVRLLGTLHNEGGVLALDSTTGSWELHGGSILGGTVSGDGTESLRVTNDGRLDGVTLSSVVLFIASGNDVLVSGDLTLDDATIRFDRTSNFTDTRLRFDDGALQTLAGLGEVIFDGSSSGNLHRQRVEAINEGAHLVLAAGITVRTGTQAGQIGNADYPVTNHGRLLAETANRTLILVGNDLVNQGILEAREGGQLDVRGLTGDAATVLLEGESSRIIVDGIYTLNESVNVLPGARLTLRGEWENPIAVTVDAGTFDLEGDWSNTGAIFASESLVQLDGTFTLAELGDFSRSGGTVRLTGTLDNAETTLDLDEAFGSWNLHGGTILGGEVTGSEDAVLGITDDGRLEQVTLSGIELFIASGNDALVSGDLTLDDAVIRFDRTSNFTDTRLRFDDGALQTLAGAGEVIFDGSSSGNLHRQRVEAINEGAHLVLAAGITVRTGVQAGQIGNASYPLTNHGRLVAETSNRTLIVTGSEFVNQGTLEARGGGTLDAQDLGANAGHLLAGAGGRIITGGNLGDFDSLTFEIGALSGNQFGRIEVSGTATLGESAEVLLTGEAPLNLGDSFTVLEAGSVEGVFAEVTIPEESGVPVLELSYDAQSVIFAVPQRAPLQPIDPVPADGMAEVIINPTLSWNDGGLSESFRLHLGVNPNPMAEPELSTQETTSFNPATLEWGTTYYWQIVALNEYGQTPGPVWSFTTRDEPDLSAGTYWTAAGGNWTDGGNWTSTPHYPDNESPDPGDRYTVIIDAAGVYEIILDSDVTIDRLILDAPGATLRHTGGTLTVLDEVEVLAGTYELAGGTLAEGRLSEGAEGSVQLTANSRFENVTIDSSLEMIVPNSRILYVSGDLTLDNATVRMHSTGSITRIRFDGQEEQHLAGVGEVVFDGDSTSDTRHRVESWGTGTHLVIGEGITIRSGEMGGQIGVSQALTNAGVIVSGTPGRTMEVTTNATFNNNGILVAENGGILEVNGLIGPAGAVTILDAGTEVRLDGDFVVDQDIDVPAGSRLSLAGEMENLASIDVTSAQLDLSGNWVNSGLISAFDSLVDLGGVFRFSDTGIFDRIGGTVRLTGTLNNEGATLHLNETTGSWDLHGGRILGGTIAFADGEALNLTTSSTLENTTLDSSVEFVVSNGNILYVAGNLTLNDAIVRMHSTGSITRIRFEDGEEQHLAGSGEIVFDGDSTSDTRHRVESWSSGTHLIIAEGITIRSGEMGGQIGVSRDVTNHGTIVSETPGRTVEVATNESFTNTGNLRAENGGVLEADGLNGPAGGITVIGQDSRVLLDGNFVVNQNIDVPEGTRLGLLGTVENQAVITVTDARLDLGGSWSNDGVINAVDSLVDLGGTFSLAGLGAFNRTAGTVRLTGTLENEDVTLLLDETTGSWDLHGGRVVGGTIAFADGETLNLTASSTLENATLDSSVEFVVSNGNILYVVGNLTLNDAILRMHSTGSITRIRFEDGEEQHLAGTGEIVFDGDSTSDTRHRVESWSSGTHLVIAEAITIRSGEMGGQVGVSRALTNHGTIVSETPGRTVEINTNETFVNTGLLWASGGGGLTIASLETNTGHLRADASSRIEVGDDAGTGTGFRTQIGGTNSSEYGRLTVSGEATLEGVLEVTFTDAFAPQIGDLFEIIAAGSVEGTFASVEAPEEIGDGFIEVIYREDGVAILISGAPPLQARDPFPADGQENVARHPILSWSDGGLTSSFNVYFGTEPEPGVAQFQGTITGTGFDPGQLDYATTYYWRVDSENEVDLTSGEVWSFTTRPEPASIAGIVWRDDDGDGVFGPEEAPIEDRWVYLDLNNNGVRNSGEPQIRTEADGSYLFDDLAPGEYVVRKILPNAWEQTFPEGGTAQVVTVEPGEDLTGVDFGSRRAAPVVVAASTSPSSPIPATNELVVTIRFDRTMDPAIDPEVTFVPQDGAEAPVVPGGGQWSRTSRTNDTYRTPPIDVAAGMDGEHAIRVAEATDPFGLVMESAEVLQVAINATPPQTVTPTVTNITESTITIGWSEYEAPADLNLFRIYREDAPFASLDGLAALDGTGAAAREYTFTGLDLDREYHVAVGAVDTALNMDREVTSIPVIIESDLPPPLTPELSSPRLTAALLEWSDYDTSELFGFAGYWIFVEETDFSSVDGLEPYAVTGPEAESYEVGGLDRTLDYYLAVVPFNRLDEYVSEVTTVHWRDPLAETLTVDLAIGGEGETFEVFNPLVVEGGATLTLRAGTTLTFAANAGIEIVEGRLFSEGTPEHPVHLTAAVEAGRGAWQGVILGPGADGSEISHTWIRHGGGLLIDGSRDHLLQGLRVVWNLPAGIELMNGAEASVHDSFVALNEDDGLWVGGDSTLTLRGSVIKNNAREATVENGSSLDARENWWGSEDLADVSLEIEGDADLADPLTREPILGAAVSPLHGPVTGDREIVLRLMSPNATSFRASEDSTFAGVFFQDIEADEAGADLYRSTPVEAPFTLSDGAGVKTLFIELRAADGSIADPITLEIEYVTDGPVITAFSLQEGDEFSRPAEVSGSAESEQGIAALEFFVEGELVLASADGELQGVWDFRGREASIVRVRLQATDTLGLIATREHNVRLSPEPPPPPTIVSPLDGSLFSDPQVTVSGTAEPGVDVQVVRNGIVLGTVTAGGDGTFTLENAQLSEGSNTLVARATDAVGSTSSPAVNVNLDTVPPAPLIVESAEYLTNRGIQVFWRFPTSGKRATSFRVLWSEDPIETAGDADGQSDPITVTDYLIEGIPDGDYYIAVVGFDGAGNSSGLSNVLTAIYDDTPPAFTIAYDQAMPMGPGDLGITLTASEALRSTPTLTVRPANFSTPISVSLTEAGGNTYTGTYLVSPLSGSTGTAEVRVSGRDLAGNSFAGAPSGPDLVFDLSRPVASIAVDQAEPVQVFDGDTDVGITLTLNKSVPGPPSLTFSPPDGPGVAVSLSGEGSVWEGILTLTESMGTGLGTFVFSVTDALGNEGTAIESGGELEIYNTEAAPPPPVPTGLEAVTRTAGEIGIQWNPSAGAEVYHLYRAEGGTGPHPTERVASGLTETVFFDTPPEDGFYRYAVSSERLGSESDLSGMVSAESDRTPPEVPENVTAELDLAGTVRISWDAPSSGETPAGYRVYRNDSHVASRANPGIVTDAPPRGVNAYRVASVDSVGNENRSDPVTVELFVGAVSSLVATVTEGGAPELSWIGEDEEAVGYNVYAGGELLNQGGPLVQPAFNAAEPVDADAVEFRVRAVDSEGRESAARTVTVYPVTADLGFNLDSAGNDRELMARYFDVYEISATHSADSDWEFQEVAVTRFEGGNATEISLPLDAEAGLVEAGAAGSWDIVFPGVIDAMEDYTFMLELRQVEEDDSVALYRGHFNGPVAVEPSIMIAVTTSEPPLAGGENDFRARLYNRGYADMDVLLVRSGGSEPGDLILEVLDANGSVVHAVPFDRPVSGMSFTGDGRGYLRIPPGESKSVLFENVLVPESLAEEGSARIRVRAPAIYQAMGTSRQRTSGPLRGSMTTNLVESPYFGVLQTDAPGYADDQPITLTGQAIDRETGLPVPNADLSIGFYVRGFHWFRQVTTDENGNFTYEYTPPPGLSGSIGFWASHPDVVDVLDQAEVSVLRVLASPARGEIRMSKNDTLDFNLQLINPGDLPMALDGVSARFYIVDDEDEEIEIDTVTLHEARPLPSNLGPDSRNRVHLRLQSELDAPDLVMAEITFETEEGASALFRAEITLLQAIPILRVAEPSRGYVDRSLDRGDQRSRRVTITNAGLRALEGVEIVPPQNVEWMNLSLPADEDGIIRVPDLAVGDQLEFQVVYAPPNDTELGFYDDFLVIRGDNAVGDFEMSLFAEITSNLTGEAQFVVSNIIDQRVPNASIRLRNTVNRIERGPYYTNAEGEFLAEELQEGRWSWQVTAPGHSAATGTVDVEPDQVILVEPELNRSLVTVTFDVVPVPFTDRYEIRIEQTFETRVPAPVMLFSPPMFEFENVDFGFETTIMAELRNEGLISVNDVEIEGGQSDLMSITPLIEYIPELRPEQVVEIPVRVRIHEDARNGNGAGPQASPLVFNPHPSPCGAVSGEDFAAGIGAIMDLAAEGEFGSASRASLKKALAAMFIGATVYESVTQVGSGGLETVIGFVGGFIECAGHFMSGSTRRGGGTPSRGGGTPGPRPAFEAGGRGCFLPDTPVTLADGTTRAISELAAGDRLRAGPDPRSVGTLSYLFRLESDDVHTLVLRCLDGTREDQELHVTGEHRLWQDGRGWTHVRNLSTGDWLAAEGGGHWEIASMERLEGEHTVYTFQLTGDHAFYADGVLAEDVCGGAFLDLSHVEVVSQ